ncbi:oxidoreductase (plasmid) [Deinococcus aetherius]|uniref:Oxidoreductase n=1 Tax=Deinococcus aetherius TaxID=200252 RepID=A0ABN6RJW6_9DEIO|nr:NAD(P)-binding domain-containing protein [Deinococcus aetherius]BDP43630.1 oxidoreductase [Deinococcus aetherius]
MNIAMLGSGGVGQTVGKKLAELGHEVVIGTRHPERLDEKKGYAGSLREWRESTGGRGRVATFADAAAHGEIVVNAVSGLATLDALHAAGEANLRGKVLLDLANELDMSGGAPRSLATDTRSLAEDIQHAFPEARVVKSLNTMSALVMVDPGLVPGGDSTVFLSGDDAGAKAQVADLLRDLGWRDILDLGDLTSARGAEMLLPIWLRLWQQLGTATFNFKIAR